MKKLFVVLGLFLFLAGCEKTPEITLNGEDYIEVELNETFEDPGVTTDGENCEIIIEGSIDNTVVAVYDIEYRVVCGDVESVVINRTISVVDNEAPTYTLKETIYVVEDLIDYYAIFESYGDNSGINISITSNFDTVVDKSVSGEYDIEVTLEDESENITDVAVTIQYFSNTWDYLWAYMEDNGTYIVDEEFNYYYILIEEELIEYTLIVYDDQVLVFGIEETSWRNENKSTYISILFDFNDYFSMNQVEALWYNDGVVTAYGYDYETHISSETDVVFDDSYVNILTFLSFYEEEAERQIIMLTDYFETYFSITLELELK
jgi:hypothetical protein